ncbi:DUF1707 SHOCT-like domain-containing protein [Nonomuraea sp. NPDC004297]
MEQSPQRRGSQTSHLRASDRNRDQVTAMLGEALSTGQLSHDEYSERLDSLYQAKTLGELDILTQDLQLDGHRPAAGPVSSVPGASPEPENIVAVFSSAERRGRWRVRARTKALALFGGLRFDLTAAEFEAREVEITINAIFGWAEIIVPEGVEVRCQGIGVFGGFDVHGSPDVDPSAPVVVVKGWALFGGARSRARGRRDS